uniref:Uncharacterized protein n=1 Tax=Nothobranchius furzeri TaxID=105023 RepID=A0A1A7ZNN9_NOTFU
MSSFPPAAKCNILDVSQKQSNAVIKL